MGDAKNNPTSCYSYVGKQGAMDGTPGQVINLGHSDCFEGGRVLHEILHGLGEKLDMFRPLGSRPLLMQLHH